MSLDYSVEMPESDISIFLKGFCIERKTLSESPLEWILAEAGEALANTVRRPINLDGTETTAYISYLNGPQLTTIFIDDCRVCDNAASQLFVGVASKDRVEAHYWMRVITEAFGKYESRENPIIIPATQRHAADLFIFQRERLKIDSLFHQTYKHYLSNMKPIEALPNLEAQDGFFKFMFNRYLESPRNTLELCKERVSEPIDLTLIHRKKGVFGEETEAAMIYMFGKGIPAGIYGAVVFTKTEAEHMPPEKTEFFTGIFIRPYNGIIGLAEYYPTFQVSFVGFHYEMGMEPVSDELRRSFDEAGKTEKQAEKAIRLLEMTRHEKGYLFG